MRPLALVLLLAPLPLCAQHAPPPIVGGQCGSRCTPTTRFRVEYLDQNVKVPQLNLKEVDTNGQRQTLELKEDNADRTSSELTLKPRKITREVTECTFKPEWVTDPVTGCKRVVMKPVTETRLEETIVYDACVENKPYRCLTLRLQPKVEDVVTRRLTLEPKLEDRRQIKGYLVPSVRHERIIDMGKPCAPESK